MALLTSELERIKTELGYNALTLSALPYAFDGITQIFEQIVQPYLEAGELNFSATVVAATAPPSEQLFTLTLVNAPTAIVQGDLLVIDQGDAQEDATATIVVAGSPATIQVVLQKAHVGTYPVTVQGGEATARMYLRECMSITKAISRLKSRAGLKKADEVEFYASKPDQKSAFDELVAEQRYWRNELASCLGVENLREQRAAAGGMVESY